MQGELVVDGVLKTNKMQSLQRDALALKEHNRLDLLLLEFEVYLFFQ